MLQTRLVGASSALRVVLHCQLGSQKMALIIRPGKQRQIFRNLNCRHHSFHKIRYGAKCQLLLSQSRILTSFLWEIGFSKKAMTRKRQFLSNSIRLRIRLWESSSWRSAAYRILWNWPQLVDIQALNGNSVCALSRMSMILLLLLKAPNSCVQ